MWSVRIADSDLSMLERVTSLRCKTKSQHGVATQKHDRARTDWEICYFGFMGEVGVSRALGLEPNWSVIIGGDDGYDIVLPGNRTMLTTSVPVQVKTPLARATRDWLYFNDESQIKADYLVLCNVDEYETSVLIRGGISKGSFLSNCVTKNFGYGERIAVHADRLQPIDGLIMAFQKNRNIQVGMQC